MKADPYAGQLSRWMRDGWARPFYYVPPSIARVAESIALIIRQVKRSPSSRE